MVALLAVVCYLPAALIPVLLPFRLIRPLGAPFPLLSLLPLVTGALAVAFAQPLTNLLGYAVALVPLLVTFASLSIALIGIRLIRSSMRAGLPTAGLAIRTLLAAVPFLFVSPFLISVIVMLGTNLRGA